MTLSEEVEHLTRIVKENATRHCRIVARFYKLIEKLPYEEAKKRYIETMKSSEDYLHLKKQIDNIVKDCARIHKMEPWWAEAYVGINLEKIILDGFDLAWRTAPDSVDEITG